MESTPQLVYAGFASIERGMDSGKAPNLLPPNQVAYAENATVRGGFAATRPGFRQVQLTGADLAAFTTGKYQGADYYDSSTGAFVVSSGGRIFRLRVTGNAASVTDVSPPSDPNSQYRPRAYFCQAENHLIIQDGQSRAIIYNGASSRRAADDEVPIGSGPMAYWNGRLWVAKGYDYVAGNIAIESEDVLKFTENTYLAGGGAFRVPTRSGPITAMIPSAQPNTASGTGELLLFTAGGCCSSNLPVERDAWGNLETPAQKVMLLNNGSMSHRGCVLVNNDVFFRSEDGLRSFVIAYRQQDQLGNTPVSSEMRRVLSYDDSKLLSYVSAIVFDNRLLMTTLGRHLPNGAYFTGLVALDFDLISSMGEKAPPAYDGVWTGIQPYQVVKGRIDGVERAFAFTRSSWNGFVDEILVTSGGSYDPLLVDFPTVTIDDTTGTGATATAEVGFAEITTEGGGSGYAVGDYVFVDNTAGVWSATGDGVAERAALKVTTVAGGGAPTALSIERTGRFSQFPDYAIIQPTTTTGSGTGLQITFRLSVSNITVTAKGSGYQSPRVIVSGSLQEPESAATATARTGFRTELHEITKTGREDKYYNAAGALTSSRITAFIESRSDPFISQSQTAANAKRLERGDLWIDQLVGPVDFVLKFRPDQHPCWQSWFSWSVSAAYQDCRVGDGDPCLTPQTFLPQYRSRLRIPQPPDTADAMTGQPYRKGYEFQSKLQWTGYCRIKLFRMHARIIEEDVHGAIVSSESVKELECACP